MVVAILVVEANLAERKNVDLKSDNLIGQFSCYAQCSYLFQNRKIRAKNEFLNFDISTFWYSKVVHGPLEN